MSSLVAPPRVVCEVCLEEEFPGYEHMRCAVCRKWVCSNCARFVSVRLTQDRGRKPIVSTKRVCPDCFISQT